MEILHIPREWIGSLEKYLQGRGVDLSREKKLDKEIHVSLPRDGLFSLREHFKPESLDFLYIEDVHDTKFYPVILKEMLIFCKVGGFLVFKFNGEGVVDFEQFAEESKLFLGEKAALRKEDYTKEELVFQKTRAVLESGDSIRRWTFGIISGGTKVEQIDQQIQRIHELKIPEYEIIVCGKYKDTLEKDKSMKRVKYLFFEAYDQGWITAQKNAIFEHAKYENVVMMHDRILPQPDFYEGMKKYGNYFEVLSCTITNQEGMRCGDWMTYGNEWGKAPRVGLLEYMDWDEYGWIDGAFYIMKKSVWRRVQWDEALFWNQGEDQKLARDWRKSGIVQRFNPFSSCLTLSWRHGPFPIYNFNNQMLGRRNTSLIHEVRDGAKFYIKKIIGRR